MRFILTTLIVIFLAFTATAQSPIFEFECFSNANMTGDSCDICIGTSFQSRSFNGLMVYRLGVFNRWIDEPYLIRLRPGNSVEFIEQVGTNPDRITIPLNQTGFSTISGFIDSTFCAGANVDFSFFASDSLRTTAINYLDTIKIVGRGGTTVFFDTLTQKYIITSLSAAAGTNLSFAGTSSPVTLNSSTGTGVNFVAGTSISLAATGTDLTITNTAPNINQTISTTGAAGNITLSDGGGTLNLNVNDADASATNEIQALSYSAPNLSLSLGGGSVAIPQGTVTGTGAINYLSKFSSSTAITNSQIFDNGTNVGIGFASPTYPLHYYKYTKGLRMGIFGDDNTGNQSLPNYVGIDFQGYAGYVYGSIAAADRAAAVTYGGLAFFADPDVSAPTNTLRMFISGQNGNVGIGTDVLPSQKLHVKGGSLLIDNGNFLVQNNNADFTAGFIESRAATLAANDRQYLSFGHLGAELGKMGGIWSGTTYDFFVDGYAGAFNRVATFKGTGKVGIGTTTPATLLDVAGDFKLTTRTGTATKIAGFGSDDICRDLVLGTGLSISGGTLNATGTVGGTGTAGKVAYWSGTNTLTSTANFAFDGTSLAVGTSTAGAGRFNVTGNSTSVGLQVDAGTLPSFGATAQLRGSNSTSNQSIYGIDAEGSTTGASSNYLNKISNTGAGSTLLQINTTAAGGDPVVQYNLTGGSTNWIHGIDNSDGDKFKLQPFTSVGDGDAGLTITTAGLFGINNQSPLTTLDISNATDGISIPVGTSAQRPFVSDPIIRYNSELQGLEVKNSGNWHLLNSQNSLSLTGSNVAGPSLGTSPTLTINGGFETAYTITLTVGSAPAANGIIYTRNFPFLWSSAPRAVFSAANAITASEITKFYVGTTNGTSYTINANGTLTAGAVYKLNVLVQN